MRGRGLRRSITGASEVYRDLPRLKSKPFEAQLREKFTCHKPCLKRPFDIFLSGIGLIFSAWLWAIIWIVIMIEDGFPIIIRQKRIGKNGRLFNNFKFRSMKKYTLREKINIQARENDKRITRVGRFLRKCALDELPQLLNIFKGDMSFVGPRALLPIEAEVYTNGGTYTNNGTLNITEIPGYYKRISVIPGLTGIAQIWASRDILRRHKFKYDLLYIRKRSFLFDLKLILISFLVTFRSSWERRGTKLGILDRREDAAPNTWLQPLLTYWIPLLVFLALIFPAFNISNKYIFTWNTFRVFGDSIRLIVPETPLYVLSTLWTAVRDLSHFPVYAILTGLLFLLFRGFKNSRKHLSLKYFIYPGIIAAGFGFADEIIQIFIPKRGGSILDCIVDVLSVTFVLLLIYRKTGKIVRTRN